MVSSSQSQFTPVPARRSGTAPRQPATVLADLAERFARFRQGHARGARVPAELREAALAALGTGVAPGDLYRACGVSWSQVAAWKASAHAPPRTRSGGEVANVRVLSVVDDQPLAGRAATARAEHELELRLGPWSISVRLAESEDTRRG